MNLAARAQCRRGRRFQRMRLRSPLLLVLPLCFLALATGALSRAALHHTTFASKQPSNSSSTQEEEGDGAAEPKLPSGKAAKSLTSTQAVEGATAALQTADAATQTVATLQNMTDSNRSYSQEAGPGKGTGEVVQGTLDYWKDFWHHVFVRFGLADLEQELLTDPVVAILRGAGPSPEERAKLQQQREDYYQDDSVQSVRLTIIGGIVILVGSMIGFEMLLRGLPGGYGRAVAVPRLAFEPAAAAGLLGALPQDLGSFTLGDPQRRGEDTDRGTDGEPEEEETDAEPGPSRGSRAPSRASNEEEAFAGRAVPLRSNRLARLRQVRCRLWELLHVALTVDEGRILSSAGMDALIMLRFCALCGRFCVLSGVCCLLLVPLYAAGGNWWEGVSRAQGLSRYSVSNLRHGSMSLWAVVPAAYICTFILCGLLWKEYERFVALRRSFLGGEAPKQEEPLLLRAWETRLLAVELPWKRGLTPPQLWTPGFGNPADTDLDPNWPNHSYASTLHRTTSQNSSALVSSWAPSLLSPPVPPVRPLHPMHAGPSSMKVQGELPYLDLVREQARRTVLLERLSPELRDPVSLRSLLEELLGSGVVHSVAFAPPDARRLSDYLHERTHLQRKCLRSGKQLDLSRTRSKTGLEVTSRRSGSGNLSKPKSGESQCPGRALAALELKLQERRDEFGRAMSARPFPRFGGHGSSFLSTASESDPLDAWQSGPTFFFNPSGPSHGGMLRASSPIDETGEPPMTRMRSSIVLSPTLSGLPSADELDPIPFSGSGSEAGTPRLPRSPWHHNATVQQFAPSITAGLCMAIVMIFRMAVGGVARAAGALTAVVREISGTSLHRVRQLLPSSVLGTTAPPSALGTPFGSMTPCHRHSSHGRLAAVYENSTGGTSMTETAFVTFKSLQAACLACQIVLDEDALQGWDLVATPAPEPRDVVWRNVARKKAQRLVRHFFVELSLLLGLLFWSVPVSLIQVWCSAGRLSQLLPPWLREHLARPLPQAGSQLQGLVTLYLPVLALLLLLEAVPAVLYKIGSNYEGIKSRSALQMLTMRRYWRFQLATIGVTALSGSISNSLKTIVEEPASILWEFGQSLPKVAVYFLATLLSSALVVTPVSLLRVSLVAKIQWRRLYRQVRKAVIRAAACLSGAHVRRRHLTSRLRRRNDGEATSSDQKSSLDGFESLKLSSASPEDFLGAPPLAADLSALLFVLLVCVIYATIAPLILAAGVLFFVVKWQVLALQYLYVHVPRFDSGGAFWYLLWDQSLLALLLGNMTTMAVVGLQAGYAQLPFLLPLPLLPVAFKMRAEYRFAEPSKRLSLRAAKILDAQADPRLTERFAVDAYWHPGLRLVLANQAPSSSSPLLPPMAFPTGQAASSSAASSDRPVEAPFGSAPRTPPKPTRTRSAPSS